MTALLATTRLPLNRPQAFEASPPLRPLGIGLLYYPGARCPFCSGRKFHVGRVTAECVRCDAALIIADPRCASIQEDHHG